jgi:hypothetical protein
MKKPFKTCCSERLFILKLAHFTSSKITFPSQKPQYPENPTLLSSADATKNQNEKPLFLNQFYWQKPVNTTVRKPHLQILLCRPLSGNVGNRREIETQNWNCDKNAYLFIYLEINLEQFIFVLYFYKGVIIKKAYTIFF